MSTTQEPSAQGDNQVRWNLSQTYRNLLHPARIDINVFGIFKGSAVGGLGIFGLILIAGLLLYFG